MQNPISLLKYVGSGPDDMGAQLRYVLARKRRILAFAVAAVLLAALYCLAQKPMYLARTTILLEQAPIRGISSEGLYDPGFSSGEYLATQVEIINSPQLAEKVIDKLGLLDSPEFADIHVSAPGGAGAAPRWLPFLPHREPTSGSPELEDTGKRRELVVAAFLTRLSVDPIPRTQLIRVGFAASSPELAAQVADALAGSYLESGLEAHLEKSRKTTQWLNDKLGDIRAALARSEKALQDYRQREQIVDVGGDRGLAESDILENSRRLHDADKQRTELASVYQKIQEAGADYQKLEELPELQSVQLVQTARGNFLTAQGALKELNDRYGAKHPQMAAATARLEATEKTYHDQLLVAAQGIRSEFEIARQNEKSLEGSVAQAKARISNLQGKEYELRILEREVESNKQLYDTFLASFKQTDASSASESISARILEPARAPLLPYRPATRAVLLVSFLLGLVSAVLLVLLQQHFDDRVESAETLSALTGQPILSCVPRERKLGAAGSLVHLFTKNIHAAFTDAVHSLHTNIRLSDSERRAGKILVTSSGPGEGKTSLAAALALACAQRESVILVEADLRRPTLKQMFGISRSARGLLELLSGSAPASEAIFREPATGLHVLPVAELPANPGQLIDSQAFANLLVQLSTRFDRVIIDSAPFPLASESLVLARLADTVLVVCCANLTSRKAVRAGVEQMKLLGINVAGYVLNKIALRESPYYGDYYGKGYGSSLRKIQGRI